MARAGEGALEWAVALWRTPGLRHTLRAEPLPSGMGELLAVACGGAGRDTVRAAATRIGNDEAGTLEIVRFALREQLFFPDADAYRTLGVTQDAPAETLRVHHRLLQQWLHPDRCSGDDTVFAGRVNAAWDRVRTPERRLAYDRELRRRAEDGLGAAPAGGGFVWRQEVLEAGDERAVRWRRRLPLLALLSACAGLGVLALVDQARTPGPALPPVAVEAPELAVSAISLPAPRVSGRAPMHGSGRASSRPVTAAAEATDPARAATPALRSTALAPGKEGLAAAPTAAASAFPAVPAPAPESGVLASDPKARPRAPVRPSVPASHAPESGAGSVMPAEAGAATPASPIPPAPPPDPERVRAAQAVGGRLLGYLGGSGAAVPPIWDSLGAQQAAGQVRDGMAAVAGTRLLEGQWRVGIDVATLVAQVRRPDGQSGQVRARLVWREQRWLVAEVSMEQGW